MVRVRKYILALLLALCLPLTRARAQLVVEDPLAILQQLLTDIDLVATGDLTLESLMTIIEHSSDMADKLFGTASAFSEGATLYGDCVKLISLSERYLKVTTNNYNRLKSTYSNIQDWTGRDYAYAIADARSLVESYRVYYESLQRMLLTLKNDTRTIEAKREALQKAEKDLRDRMLSQTDSVDMVITSEVYSSALSAAVDALDVWSDDEVEAQGRIYGDTVESERGTGAKAGSVGTLMLVLAGLLLTVSTVQLAYRSLVEGEDMKKGIARMAMAIVIALVTAIIIGQYV